MRLIRKHPKAVVIIVTVLILVIVAGSWQRQKSLASATSTKLKDEPRKGGKVVSTFYYDQLTVKEAKAYDLMKEKLDKKEGGVIEFKEPLSGPEYLRVTSALENEGYNYFYGLYDIPMTKDDIYVKYKDSDLTTQKEDTISKAILFLSCAKGIDKEGKYSSYGKVMNLDEIQKGLSVNSQTKLDEIAKTQKQTEEVLSKIMDGLPSDYGEKKTVDYFLDWMKDHMSLVDSSGKEVRSISDMGDVFKHAYIYNNLSAVVKKKATALGYAKLLSELCNRAGMESHIVLGVWDKSSMNQNGYVYTAVHMNGQTIYVDASGEKSSETGGEQYFTEKEAKNHLRFVDYFKY